jgi:hypothetical protein
VQGDPYYWVKCEQERLGLCVYSGTEAEAGFRLQIAQERLNEAAQLMEQGMFAEANAALERYRTNLQAMNQAMVSVRERASAEAAGGGWLAPGEVVERVEQMTRAQLQTLNQLCAGAQDQVRDQVRLALEECTRTCTREQAGRATIPGNQEGTAGQTDPASATPAASVQQDQTREQNQVSEQNQGQDQEQNQEQNQTQGQQQQNGPANADPQQQAPQNQPPSPQPKNPQLHQGK